MRTFLFAIFMLVLAVAGIGCGGSSSTSDGAMDAGKDSASLDTAPDVAADTSADGGAVDAPDAGG